MTPMLTVILVTFGAGLAMLLGALLAQIEHIRPLWLERELRHSVTAFGGGALMSAVALVLVPEGAAELSILYAALWFIVGGICFMWLDIVLTRMNTPASQMAAMLSDYIPESVALGAAFSSGSSEAMLLAGLIALQNLPEGFSAFRELKQNGDYSVGKLLFLFFLMACLGPIAGVTGLLFLADEPEVVGAIMLFAAGGILYSMFQDIAPQARLEKHWAPPFGAVLGFVLGLVGYMISSPGY